MQYSSKNKRNSYKEFSLIILKWVNPITSNDQLWNLSQLTTLSVSAFPPASCHFQGCHGYMSYTCLACRTWLHQTSQASFPRSSICDYSTICDFHVPHNQGAKKVSFMACHSYTSLLVYTSLRVFFNSPEKFFDKQHWLQFVCNLNFPKNSLALWASEQNSLAPIAKSTCPRLSDTSFFARW